MSILYLFRINAIVKPEHRTKINPSKLLRDLEPFKDLTGIKLYRKFSNRGDSFLNCNIDWDNYWDCSVDRRIAVPNTYQVETGELQVSGELRDILDWESFMQFVFRELFEKVTLCFWACDCSFEEDGIYDGDFDKVCANSLDYCLALMQADWPEYYDL